MKRAINLYLDEEVIEKLEILASIVEQSKSKYISEYITIEFDMQFNNAVTTNDKEKK